MNHSKLLFLLAEFVVLLFGSVVCAFAYGTTPVPLSVFLWNTGGFFIMLLSLALTLLLLYWAVSWSAKHPGYGMLETKFFLFLNRCRKSLAQKNAAQIILPLQFFLYCVLARNREILGIDPGADARNLSPNGRAAIVRNKAVYYRFELVIPNGMDLDTAVLLQLINQFIFSELTNYGIANLPGYFISCNGKNYPSVYLDRLTYDEVRHILMFDVLFVASDAAARALDRALLRDMPRTTKSEAEVFDDEV